MFIRGQYSLLDAVPILKKMERLWPPPDGDGESTELEDGQTFNFSLTMPTQYPTNPAMDLPPSVSVAQFALQSEVTYWFKIRMKRKGWRLNDESVSLDGLSVADIRAALRFHYFTSLEVGSARGGSAC